MAKAISNIRKKSGRGRPKLGAVPVMVRLLPDQVKLLDAWRKAQPDRPGRPEALRRMLLAHTAVGDSEKSATEERQRERMTDGAAAFRAAILAGVPDTDDPARRGRKVGSPAKSLAPRKRI